MVHEACEEAASVGVGGYWSWANLYVHAPQVLCGWDFGVCRSVRHPLGRLLLERVSMQDCSYELRRTPLLGTWVNKGRRHTPGPKITLLRAEANRRRSGSKLHRRSSAENLSKMVFGPHSDVGLGGLHQHGSLEAVPGDRSHGL